MLITPSSFLVDINITGLVLSATSLNMVPLSCHILALTLVASLSSLGSAAGLGGRSPGPNGGLALPLVRRKSSGGQVGLNDVSDR